jgi:NADPH:quinone reductase-like Zn-dependent oxidoreductase
MMSTVQNEHPPTNSTDPTPDTMRAIVQDRYGTDPGQVLRVADIDVPSIAAGQVLVRVHAASIDRGTWHVMAGLPYAVRLAGFGVRRPKHTNPGRSLAGTVEAVGAGVSGFAPGDDVWGIAPGALAQFVAVDADQLDRKPERLSFEEAAAAPISGLTALQAVRDQGRVGPGTSVLVIGASGGVGSFAVQIAAAYGAEVTGVSSTAKVDLVRGLGAHHVIDYTRQDITDGGRRFDVIVDIGGNRRLSHLRRALTPDGRLVIVGGETDGRLLGGTDRQLRAILWSPFVGQTLGTFIASEKGEDLADLRQLVDSGDVSPSVERTYPLDEVAEAITRLVSGEVRGKVVITVPRT